MASSVSLLGMSLSPLALVLLSLPLLFAGWTYWLHWRGSRADNPLVWSWLPFLRSAAAFGTDPNTFLEQCRNKYGPVFSVNLGQNKEHNAYVVADELRITGMCSIACCLLLRAWFSSLSTRRQDDDVRDGRACLSSHHQGARGALLRAGGG